MTLHIYLRPAEGAAVARFFDVEKVGSVNGEHFVRWFLKAGLDSREVPLLATGVTGLLFFLFSVEYGRKVHPARVGSFSGG